MNLTYQVIYNAYTALKEISNKENIPGLVGYDLMQISSKMESQYIILEDLRNKLIKKHGTEQKEWGFAVVGASLIKFSEEINEILGKEVELDFEKLSIDRKSFEKVNIKPALFIDLKDILELV